MDYCGKYDFNAPIDGIIYVIASGILKLDTQASSLTIAVTHNGETVAFVGTQSGELKKVEHNFTIERHTFLILHVYRLVLKHMFN